MEAPYSNGKEFFLNMNYMSSLTSRLVEPLHVGLELPLEALDGVAQVLDLLAQVEVLAGEARDLVLQARLRVVRGALVYRRVYHLQRCRGSDWIQSFRLK